MVSLTGRAKGEINEVHHYHTQALEDAAMDALQGQGANGNGGNGGILPQSWRSKDRKTSISQIGPIQYFP